MQPRIPPIDVSPRTGAIHHLLDFIEVLVSTLNKNVKNKKKNKPSKVKINRNVLQIEIGPDQKNLYPGHLADGPAGHPGDRRVNPTRKPTPPTHPCSI